LNSNIKLTSLPIPNVIIITKNNIDHRGEIGNLVTTSGYTTKAKPECKSFKTNNCCFYPEFQFLALLAKGQVSYLYHLMHIV
jgi:hypothetical protein